MNGVSSSGSTLFGGLFGSAVFADHFDDRARVQGMLDFEAALARAEADLRLIPHDAALAIENACRAERFDVAALGKATALAGNPAIPLVKALTEAVDDDAARYVHWGGTSQDVVDTGLTLQMRGGFDALDAGLHSLGTALAGLTRTHRRTPAIARTLGQHAIPIPFGLRTAGWLGAITRSAERLAHVRDSCLFLHFFGAAGSLAALGDRGLLVAQRLAAHLELKQADISTHGHRDFMAEIAGAVAVHCGTLGKIAGDIQVLMQTDCAEIFEPAAPGKGGSSTMPHKRNPVSTAAVRANARQAAALGGLFLANMDHALERDPGGWHAEWSAIADLFILTGGAQERLVETVGELEVDAARMAANVDRTDGLVFAEAAMMALAPSLGRMEAHHRLEEAVTKAVTSGRHLRDVLLADDTIIAAAGRQEIVDAFDPAGYFGASDQLIDRALAAWDRLT